MGSLTSGPLPLSIKRRVLGKRKKRCMGKRNFTTSTPTSSSTVRKTRPQEHVDVLSNADLRKMLPETAVTKEICNLAKMNQANYDLLIITQCRYQELKSQCQPNHQPTLGSFSIGDFPLGAEHENQQPLKTPSNNFLCHLVSV